MDISGDKIDDLFALGEKGISLAVEGVGLSLKMTACVGKHGGDFKRRGRKGQIGSFFKIAATFAANSEGENGFSRRL